MIFGKLVVALRHSGGEWRFRFLARRQRREIARRQHQHRDPDQGSGPHQRAASRCIEQQQLAADDAEQSEAAEP